MFNVNKQFKESNAMKWNNIQFGEMDYDEKHVLMFPGGLIGFEENKKFLIIHDEDSEPFRWLVSLEDQELSFPLVELSMNQTEYFNKYFSQENVTLFAVVSIKPEVDDSTINLRSPIVIDTNNGTGRQVVLDDDQLNVRTPLGAFSPVLAE
jgi:flagellar assembly factor FliW